jgi:uncharacterized membrane protein
MIDVVVARVLHVLCVVIWIGGLAMATTVVLPAVRRNDLGADHFGVFHAIEHRFVWQARIAVVIVGLTGFYMSARLDLWDRFQSAQFWWMHAMVCMWLLFSFVLFVAEPLVLRGHLQKWASVRSEATLAWLHRAHWVLLVLSLVTIFGAVAGSHGWSIF